MRLYRILSFLFHPVVYPVSIFGLYMKVSPYYFDANQRLHLTYIILAGTVLVPVLILALFKSKGFIDSFELTGTGERKLPFALFLFLSFTLWKMFYHFPQLKDFSLYFLSGTLAIGVQLLLLFRQVKISMHTLAAGSSVGFVIWMSAVYRINLLWILILLFLVAGAVAVSRLKLQAHNVKEVAWGFALGIIATLLPGFLIYFI